MKAQWRSKAPQLAKKAFLARRGIRSRNWGFNRILNLTDFGIPFGDTRLVIPDGIPSQQKNSVRNSVRLRLTVLRNSVNFLKYAIEFLCIFQGDEATLPLAILSLKKKTICNIKALQTFCPDFAKQFRAFSRILSHRGEDLVRRASRWKQQPPLH